jgi:hypothetical protein
MHLLVYDTNWIFKMHGATIKKISLGMLKVYSLQNSGQYDVAPSSYVLVIITKQYTI